MNRFSSASKAALAVMLLVPCGVVMAQTTVGYGRITAVSTVAVDNSRAQTGGALLGGTLGLVSGRNQSGSNQALRAAGGAFAGNRLAKATTGGQAFEYTILMGGRTITMVTNEAGMRVGDCVSVEQGAFNNLRLVDDSRCNRKAQAAPPPASAVKEADACVAAKETLLKADTDEAFDRAERRVRLLCAD